MRDHGGTDSWGTNNDNNNPGNDGWGSGDNNNAGAGSDAAVSSGGDGWGSSGNNDTPGEGGSGGGGGWDIDVSNSNNTGGGGSWGSNNHTTANTNNNAGDSSWDNWGESGKPSDNSGGGWRTNDKNDSGGDTWKKKGGDRGGQNKNNKDQNQGGKNSQGKKGAKTDDEKEKSGNETKGKGGSRKDKKDQSKKEETASKQEKHKEHHHHHHEEDEKAITVRFNPTVVEAAPEEASEMTPIDSAHSPTSLRTNIPKIQIATTPPGCTCHITTSKTSSSGSSSTCSTCFIKQQTPRNYVQDLEGHWYRFAPEIDLETYSKEDVFRGSDGRAYKRISSKKVPANEIRRQARENDGANNHGQRRHSHHQSLGDRNMQDSQYGWFPAQATPVFQTMPVPTAFMRFKKVFKKPPSKKPWGTEAAYRLPAGHPTKPPGVYAFPIQPIHGVGPSNSKWKNFYHYIAGGPGGGGGYTGRHDENYHYKAEPLPNYYDDGRRQRFTGGHRPPDGYVPTMENTKPMLEIIA
ncbi:hypothetical protein ABW20_dc0101821 [Dactylellina cionopaga]|nr:hypothetical protein ABW20_dc0101821 [Dactylellina cionopaga]